MIWQHDIFSDIILTQFVTLHTDAYIAPSMDGFTASVETTRVTAFGLYTTHQEIHKLRHKWRCPNDTSEVDIWGPDSMCRCLRRYAPLKVGVEHKAADNTPLAVEEMCYREVVPVYGRVFAGSIRGYWNFYIGILMIHISIIFSMKSIEYARTEYETSQKAVVSADVVYATPGNDAPVPQDAFQRPPFQESQSTVRRAGSARDDSEVRYGNASKLSLAKAFDWTRDVDTEDNVYMQVGNSQKDLENPKFLGVDIITLWDVLVVVLSVVVVGLVSGVLGSTNDLVKIKVGGSTTVLYVWALVVAIVTGMFTALEMAWTPFVWPFLAMFMGRPANDKIHPLTAGKPTPEETAAFESMPKRRPEMVAKRLMEYLSMCVMQDLNYITGFMLVISTFSAQGGEHDDHTIFVDVACVLFIGFLQHLSHLTMLLKEQALGMCEDQIVKLQPRQENAQADSKEAIRSPKYEARMLDYIFQFFSTTRAFIFAGIGISVYVFSVRMGPTVFGHGQDSMQSWNGSARLFTLLFFVSPSILYDLYYELVHFDHMRRYQRHLQYFGPQVWRVWGGIAFILVLCGMTLQGYGGDENMQYQMNRFLGGVSPWSN